jgi:hypothetical protein
MNCGMLETKTLYFFKFQGIARGQGHKVWLGLSLPAMGFFTLLRDLFLTPHLESKFERNPIRDHINSVLELDFLHMDHSATDTEGESFLAEYQPSQIWVIVF